MTLTAAGDSAASTLQQTPTRGADDSVNYAAAVTTRRTLLRTVGLGLLLAPAVGTLVPGALTSVVARTTIKTKAHTQEQDVDGEAVYLIPFVASHAAVYWDGAADAQVTAAFSADGTTFGPRTAVGSDELGAQRHDGRTYGAVMRTDGAVAVRIAADRKLHRVGVVGMADGERTVSYEIAARGVAAATMPPVIRRAEWGCDESLMTWTPEFYPVQKLICHHTATQNGDPDPAATMRSIYYYHAVTQNWGDIGYNFLVDEAGRIYEGRYSRTYLPGEYPNGENGAGNGVTAAHAYQFNSGTVGIALLGTLTSVDTTANGRAAIESMLAWKAATHGIDPKGTTRYTNPVTGVATTFANISGHRDVVATECPGGAFYATLPTVRNDVAAQVAGSAPPTPTPTPIPTPTPRKTPTPTRTPRPRTGNS